MSLVTTNWNPTEKDLNGFRWVALCVLPGVAALLHLWKGVPLSWCAGIAGAGMVTWASGFLSLTLTRWIFVGLMAVTLPIGLVVSFVVMSIFFFGLLTPVGLVFRVMKRDILKRQFDPSASTYWQAHTQVQDSNRYFQQF